METAPKTVPSDIDIAQATKIKHIRDIAESIGLTEEDYDFYGKHIAKLTREKCHELMNNGRPDGKLVLVTAMTPTPAGEGKTTTSVGLSDGLRKIGKKTMLCLREPSLGPCFGVKGGAAGGGYAQVVPMEDINLHFTGDFHAIGLANNLLAAALDNHIHQGNALNIDPRRVVWPRVVDMNDRALRKIVLGLGGPANGVPREGEFQITVASEVMAIFCLSNDLADLKRRLGNITCAYTYDKKPVFAKDLKVHGSMAALLKEAVRPNLVQTLEYTPAFVHGGPFANIAHGANSIIATKCALKLADYVITEAGFGSDLGGEKFVDIVCRKAGFKPGCVVIVATVRALKMHGGVAKKDLAAENLDALGKGITNLEKHIENMRGFGLPVIVALNHFVKDTPAEVRLLMDKCKQLGVEIVESRVWEKGGEGGKALAEAVVKTLEKAPSNFTFLYEDGLELFKKVERIARKIYGASGLEVDKSVRDKFKALQDQGLGHLPVCMAKTQYSLSADPGLLGRPTDYTLQIRDIRVATGAEFLVAYCGDIMTMPGLPKVPAAEIIDIDGNGKISGLF